VRSARGRAGGRHPWRNLAAVSVLAVYAHVLFEWLFFLTKPSFMGTLDGGDRLTLLLVPPLPLAAGALVPLALLAAVARGCGATRLEAAGRVVPAIIAAGCAFLLIDNFTYTLFGMGVVSTTGLWGLGYAGLVVGLLVAAHRRLGRMAPAHARGLWRLACALLVVSAVAAAWRGGRAAPAPRPPTLPAAHGAQPDILILSGDGINAGSMSAYGYERDTTPFLRVAMRAALVCERAYPNANFSAASIASMLSGRSPVGTGVAHHPPDILRGAAAHEHLPGILRRLGYHGLHLGLRPYTDPFDLNMQDGFEAANFRVPVALGSRLPRRIALAYDVELYFLGQMIERLLDRILHVAGLRPMSTDVAETHVPMPERDRERVDALLDFLERSPGPVFAHVHLMGPHGPTFRTAFRRFARGAKRRSVRAQYDDAILEFDRHVARVFDRLRRRATLANTLVVIASDHGERWSYGRIPLLFFFPGGAQAGTVESNVQLLDVAPTILDYLGVTVPEWMDGASLLPAGPDPARAIVSVLYSLKGRPPALQYNSIAAMSCDRLLRLDMASGLLRASQVYDHPASCPPPGPNARALVALLRSLAPSWRARSTIGPLRAVEGARR
jgi:hypothetical protein